MFKVDKMLPVICIVWLCSNGVDKGSWNNCVDNINRVSYVKEYTVDEHGPRCVEVLFYFTELPTYQTRAVKQVISSVVLMHAVDYFNCLLIIASVQHVYLCCMLSSANNCTSRLQDATTVYLSNLPSNNFIGLSTKNY